MLNKMTNYIVIDSENVIATYHDDETNKDFVFYTDNTYSENNKLNVYYGYYKETEGMIVVTQIDDKKDETIAFEVLKELIKKED